MEIEELLWIPLGAWFHTPGFAAKASPVFFIGLQRPVLDNRVSVRWFSFNQGEDENLLTPLGNSRQAEDTLNVAT